MEPNPLVQMLGPYSDSATHRKGGDIYYEIRPIIHSQEIKYMGEWERMNK